MVRSDAPLTTPVTHHSPPSIRTTHYPHDELLPPRIPPATIPHPPTSPQATALFESDPHRFVAKNALRPRTGSNQTQDRLASGGALVTGAAPLRALLRDASRRACYLLYRKARQ